VKILVTGAAGFIGAHAVQRLVAEGHTVIGIDNMNSYYDPALKEARVKEFLGGVDFSIVDVSDEVKLSTIFKAYTFDRVMHLAAQAGVRHSIEHPLDYAHSNYVGTQNIFEAAHRAGDIPVVYASSSSVYGDTASVPFSETERCDEPVSVYAATKRANELLAHVYTTMYGMQMTGLRFFTVYGPWGRPDMAYFTFTQKTLSGESISLYNAGELRRDFTYIDDIVDGVVAAVLRAPAGFRLYNLGRGESVPLRSFVSAIEEATGKSAMTELVPMQAGDVHETYANIERARVELGYAPTVSVREGIGRFVEWYRAYYNV
jgi:UDP-glucuronate 4-epimerase